MMHPIPRTLVATSVASHPLFELAILPIDSYLDLLPSYVAQSPFYPLPNLGPLPLSPLLSSHLHWFYILTFRSPLPAWPNSSILTPHLDSSISLYRIWRLSSIYSGPSGPCCWSAIFRCEQNTPLRHSYFHIPLPCSTGHHYILWLSRPPVYLRLPVRHRCSLSFVFYRVPHLHSMSLSRSSSLFCSAWPPELGSTMLLQGC